MEITTRQWIDKIALALNVASPSDDGVDQLLSLAAVAAHASDRTAAPVTCWIAAHADMDLSEVLVVAQRQARELEGGTS